MCLVSDGSSRSVFGLLLLATGSVYALSGVLAVLMLGLVWALLSFRIPPGSAGG